jgi:peptide/nickel transport system permease protein
MTGARSTAWTLLIVVALVAACPDFCSPYPPSRQFRDLPYAAPGRYHGGSVQWLVRGEPYRWLGVVPASLRLFGSPEPGRVFLLGTDEFGRDWYSRLCHGASVSLLLAPAAALLSLTLAIALGGWAGYHGGWIDRVVMSATEVFVVLPWFYVVVALRAALPLTLSSEATLFTVFALLSVLGSATPARLFRGIVLSTRSAGFVFAARAAGAPGLRIFRSHLLPFLMTAAWTQFLVTVPAYIITEVTLSFLGIGVAEPTATWGGMLAPLQQYIVLTSYPWMFAPAVAVVVVCFALQVVAQTATAIPVPVAANTPSYSP